MDRAGAITARFPFFKSAFCEFRDDISIPFESILILECMRYENLILKELLAERDSVWGDSHGRRRRRGCELKIPINHALFIESGR